MNAPAFSFTFNPEAARAADAPLRINKTGAYVGKFTRAEYVVSDGGTTGIDLSFVAEDGSKADYLTLWLKKSDGTELRGTKVLSALLRCVNVKTITTTPGTVRTWDNKTKTEGTRAAQIIPALMNVPVGLVLQREEYWPNSGGEKKDRMNLQTVFQAGTNLMAKEIMDKVAKAEALAKYLPTVQDKLAPARAGGASNSQSYGGNSYGTQAGGDAMGHAGQDIPDDDIPF